MSGLRGGVTPRARRDNSATGEATTALPGRRPACPGRFADYRRVARAAKMRRMRLLYIDVDSLNPSHLGCYGYPRNTSAAIDQLAREGVRFDQVYCSDAPCLPSRTAMYSGRFGIHTGVVGHGGSSAQPRVQGRRRDFRDDFDNFGLARQLQKLGHHTAMVSPFGQRHAAHWFYAGFNEIHNTGKCGMESAEDVQPTVEEWLTRHAAARKDWYLHVNYWDAHTPYRAPASYGDPFERDPLPAWMTQEVLDRHARRVGPHSALDLGMYWGAADPRFPRVPDAITDLKTLKQWIDGYDTGIRVVDDQVARIVELLKSAGVYDETAIILSADHGENQGQLGIYGEHATADAGTCRVPLIVRWPGGRRGQVDAGLHYQLDLAPTLMDLFGGEKPAIWDGQSFAGAIAGRGPGAGRDDLVISQCAHVCQRSVRFGRWLYVRTYHCGFHLFPDEMLFDLVADPNEQRDVAGAHPQVCHEGAARLERWHAAQMRRLADASHASCQPVTDPLWTVIAEAGRSTQCTTRPARSCRRTSSGSSPPAGPRAPRRCAGSTRRRAADDNLSYLLRSRCARTGVAAQRILARTAAAGGNRRWDSRIVPEARCAARGGSAQRFTRVAGLRAQTSPG